MGKLDDLTRALGGNVAESMGAGRNAGLARGAAASSGIPERMKGVNRTKNAVEIPTGKIERDPDQPREVFEDGALARLAESLKTRGQLQAIRVRWDEERGIYVVIAGERRWRAAKMANIATISAVVVEGEMSAPELLALQLVENCLREDLASGRAGEGLPNLDRAAWLVDPALGIGTGPRPHSCLPSTITTRIARVGSSRG